MAVANIEYPKYSMFQNTPVYRNGENVEFGLLREAVVADSTDKLYIVNQITQDRLDLVSQVAYGTPELWWVIALVNNITDPMTVPNGMRLRIPIKSRLSLI